jgi:hypothetical protein
MFYLSNISLLLGFISNKMPEKVLDLLDEMIIKPDQVTLALIFNACTQLADERAIKIGEKLLDEMPNGFRNHNVLQNSALHMLMRFGDVNRAEHFFELIKKKDSISYNVMMNGNHFLIFYISSQKFLALRYIYPRKQHSTHLYI